jgi:hypothetical protein
MLKFSEKPMGSSHICNKCDMFSLSHPILFKLFLPQYQQLSPPFCFENLQFMSFVSTDTDVTSADMLYTNENTWPSVDLQDVKMTANNTKKISDCLGTCSVFGTLQAGG